MNVGRHQGSTLSPFLFTVVTDVITEEVRREPEWADDIIITNESGQRLDVYMFSNMHRRLMDFAYTTATPTKNQLPKYDAVNFTAVVNYVGNPIA